MTPHDFIKRWTPAAGSEQANAQLFVTELCALLGVKPPSVATGDATADEYVFEKPVCFNNGDGTTSQGRADLYKLACFVWESKQGSERKAAEAAEALATVNIQKKLRAGFAERGTAAWDQAMAKARQQAKRYAEALPEWPPFLIVADVGYCLDLYADFSQSGKHYVPFPDPQNYRIPLADLAKESVQELLRTIWDDPYSLDPTRRSAKVTRELAARLARLAQSLEQQKDHAGQPCYTPERVAQFLMRCLFTMFAEDVELIEKESFNLLLRSLRGDVTTFAPMVRELWEKMNTGGFSTAVRQTLRVFNGGLFADCEALPLNADQLELLIESSDAHWTEVEPAIFGTLLERALDPVERHKFGAHFTPRAYVERLVMPTIIEPLRDEWQTAYATATQLYNTGKITEAQKAVKDFHGHLCEIHVLDPACGSGNFLYVALELMKRLEGEVLLALREFGDRQMTLTEGTTVNPHQFLGIDVNARAVAIADLVLWIGYLQWQFRSVGQLAISGPVIRKYKNLECRDAVLAWDAVEPVFDDDGKPVTRWDGRTTKSHPVTGEEVPDETARVQELRYVNPRKAEWPKVDYIVGNPPFIGNKRMRLCLGDGYTETLRRTWNDVSETTDYVMYWWQQAAMLCRADHVERFGFIATNSLRQTFNRRIIETHLSSPNRIALRFAIPDHPWVDSADGAAVRISMTVAAKEAKEGRLWTVSSEHDHGELGAGVSFRESLGDIRSDLTLGADVGTAATLRANQRLSNRGVSFVGSGFVVTSEEAKRLGLGRVAGLDACLRPTHNGRDLSSTSRGNYAIDLLGMSLDEVKQNLPEVFQWIYERVKPERDVSQRHLYREKWWIFGEPRASFRPALSGLDRFVATTMTAKHRFFVFEDSTILPDQGLVAIASDDAFFLGVLSSRIHVTWTLAAGGTLEDRPRYNNTRCFDTFAFPATDRKMAERIQTLSEQLDAHRKRQQKLHPTLTMTGMYNVLEKLRAGDPLTKKDQQIHEQGLVSVLKQIHDDLDAAVFDAYGWPHDLSDEAILERLVALNHERAEEEKRGLIRWLRPEYQKPLFAKPAEQQDLDLDEEPPAEAPVSQAVTPQPWPKAVRDQVREVREALSRLGTPALPADVIRCFTRAPKAAVAEILETLVDVGQARQTDQGLYVP